MIIRIISCSVLSAVFLLASISYGYSDSSSTPTDTAATTASNEQLKHGAETNDVRSQEIGSGATDAQSSEFRSTSWNDGKNWQSAMTVLTFLTVLVLFYQVRQLRRATRTQAFCNLIDRLQSEEVRAARRAVLSEFDDAVDRNQEVDWIAIGLDQKAQIVCHTYDIAGQMVNSRMVPKKLVTSNWGHSIMRCWHLVKPLVEYYRGKHAKGTDVIIWDDFEKLAKKCGYDDFWRGIQAQGAQHKAVGADEINDKNGLEEPA